MKHYLLLASMLSLLPLSALAVEEPKPATEETKKEDEKSELRANFRRIALDVSSTSVSNADQYQNSSVSALNADSETMIKGVFDFMLEYEQPTYRWDNGIYMAYGKTTLKPHDGTPKTKSENSDQIILSTDIAYKMWKVDEADVGPFNNFQYETEFTADNDNPRTKILRDKVGIKLFNGQYFESLYAAAVGEYDMTYPDDTSKLALEVGTRAKFPLREGVNFELEGYYRDYIHYSDYVGEDLEYDLNAVGRMNVQIVDKLSLSPFMSYRYAESRQADAAGSNFMIGVSLSYSNIFNLD